MNVEGPHELEGRIALVTGASGGLGAAVSRALLQAGARVAGVDIVPAPAGGPGDGYRHYVGDVADEDVVDEIHERIHSDLGPVDVVCNVAGVLHRTGLADCTAAQFSQILDANLLGTYVVIRAFADDMTGRGWGRIINVASIAALRGYPSLAYAASKAGIASLTRSLLFDLWGTGVTVNAVCPGAMDTAMMDRTILDRYVSKTPAERIVTPEEIAGTFVFLCSSAASSINGDLIVVDGGATAVFAYHDRD